MLSCDDRHATATGACYTCFTVVFACPDCVNTVDIDPVTNLPVGTAITAQGVPVLVPYAHDARARALKALLCDTCVDTVNAAHPHLPRVETHQIRHARHLSGLDTQLHP